MGEPTDRGVEGSRDLRWNFLRRMNLRPAMMKFSRTASRITLRQASDGQPRSTFWDWFLLMEYDEAEAGRLEALRRMGRCDLMRRNIGMRGVVLYV